MKCYHCEHTRDLRPYGPNGSMVCYKCATATPEREAETERNFMEQFKAAGPVVIIDDSNIGPYPAKHHPEVNQILKDLGLDEQGEQ